MRVRVPGGGRWLFAAALLGLVVTLAGVGTARAPAPPAVGPRVAGPVQAPRSGEASLVGPADPVGIRDVFRFADEPLPAAHPGPVASARADGERAPAPAPGGPRLVGLVRRAGRLMAALSVDGEVELAGPGDSAAGVTVLSVGEEGVRVRCADGSEQTLALP
jgi:hypothetical protein